jgi:hypothetical protein
MKAENLMDERIVRKLEKGVPSSDREVLLQTHNFGISR